MASGTEFYSIATKLGDYNGVTFNVHLAIITAILGGLSGAYAAGAPISSEIRFYVAGFYFLVSVSNLIFLHETYRRLNAALTIARAKLLDEEQDDEHRKPIEALTEQVKGYVLRIVFPAIIVAFLCAILNFPSAPG